MPRGTTTQQGVGWEHQKIVATLHRNHADGTLCDRCWQPMYRDPARNPDGRKLQGGHPHDRPRAVDKTSKATHLEHARCNESGLMINKPESIVRDW